MITRLFCEFTAKFKDSPELELCTLDFLEPLLCSFGLVICSWLLFLAWKYSRAGPAEGSTTDFLGLSETCRACSFGCPTRCGFLLLIAGKEQP